MEEFLVILRKDLCENSFDNFSDIKEITLTMPNRVIYTDLKYSLQGTTQSRYLTGGVPPVRFSM